MVNFDGNDSPCNASYCEIIPLKRIINHGIAFDIFGGGGGPDYSGAAAAASAGYERSADKFQEMYNQTRKDLAPGIQGYRQAVPYMGSLLQIPGYDKIDPTATLRGTPGYGFTMDQGTDAMSRYAAARGLSMSPATLKGIQTYGQGMADKTYQQYLQNVGGFMGAGQNAAAQTGGFGMNAAQGMGNAYSKEGEANANAILASGLQRQSGYGGIGSLLGMGAGILAAPFTGGTSLFGSAMSGLSGLFGGGGGGGFNPSAWEAGSFSGGIPW